MDKNKTKTGPGDVIEAEVAQGQSRNTGVLGGLKETFSNILGMGKTPDIPTAETPRTGGTGVILLLIVLALAATVYFFTRKK